MDHFLFARNPLKKTAPTGLQGYIIDTVKGTWMKVEVFHQQGKPDRHDLTMIAGTGDNKEDRMSAHRGSRWYSSILVARKVEDAEIVVTLPKYTGEEPKPEKRYDYGAVAEESAEAAPDQEAEAPTGELYDPPGVAPVVSLAKKLGANGHS